MKRIFLKSPSPAQIEAGNYKKRHIVFQGLQISVENPKGSVRRGTDASGKQWRTKMRHHYGYIRRTEGLDGDHVDCYVGPDKDADTAYIVHQRKAGDWKAYDEDKCMIGFSSEQKATAAYLAHYDDPRFLGPITAMPMDEFKRKVLAAYEKPKMIKAVFLKSLLWSATHSHSADSGIQPALQSTHNKAGRAGQSAKQKEGMESIAQKDENDNPKIIKSVVFFKSSGTPRVGDKIEFLSDRLTDKGPSSGVVTDTKTTVDGAYLRVRHSDTEEWMSWEDLRPHAKKQRQGWLIKSYVKPHRRVTKTGKVVFVSGYRNKVVPKAKGGSSKADGDAKTADMFNEPDKEESDSASVSAVWILPERSTDDERLLRRLPGSARFAQGKTALNKGKWTVLIDDKMAGNWRDTKEDAVRDAEHSIAAKERFVRESEERKAGVFAIAQRLLAGGEPTDADIKFFGLKIPAGFRWISPVVQELFGISRAKVRIAMGDALRESRSDMGVVYWVANPKRALMNAAAYARNAP